MPVGRLSSLYENACLLIFGAAFRHSLLICLKQPKSGVGNFLKQVKSVSYVLQMQLAWDVTFLTLSAGVVLAVIEKQMVYAFFLYQNGLFVQKNLQSQLIMFNTFNVVTRKASKPKQTPSNRA
jgi:hypothetical protein